VLIEGEQPQIDFIGAALPFDHAGAQRRAAPADAVGGFDDLGLQSMSFPRASGGISKKTLSSILWTVKTP